jgi:hypothetical protein
MRPRQRYLLPVEYPEVAPGEVTGPPDLVGIGAQRAGTTWWWRGAIRSHPAFHREVSPGKEIHFFDRYWDGREVPGDLADLYARQFPRPEGKVTGEWTPRYMHDFWALPLLHSAAPDARILVMLRDPVERYRSGIERERRIAEKAGEPLEIAIVGDAVYRSLYSTQLRRLFELYPRERVLVLQYERCRAEPLAEMRRTHDFLGLDPLTEVPTDLDRQVGKAREKPPLPGPIEAELTGRLAEDARLTAEICPEIDLGMWPTAGS